MSSRTKILFLSPPTTAYIEPKDVHERHLEVALPRIPFEVLANIVDGIEGVIVDLDWELDKLPDTPYSELIYSAIRKHQPDIVLTSMYAQSVSDVIDQITTSVKEIDSSIPVIVGGQAISHLKERVFSLCPDIDFACEDVQSLEGALRRILQGDLSKALLRSPQRLEELPVYSAEEMYRGFPIRDFVDYYRTKGIEVIAYLENERGCPYKCTFCAARRPVKERAIAATLAEARHLLSNGINTFYLIDLTFGVNERKTVELLEAFKALRADFPRFRFRCITRVDYLTADIAQQLVAAGCYEVGLGIESSSSETLFEIRKGTTRHQNLQAISNGVNAGLAVRLFLILGLPGDSVRGLYEFLHEVNAISGKVLIQPSLLREIVGPSFRTRLECGDLHRGVMHQLDFRTDGRRFGLDRDEDIVNYILLSLAWPSTEISQKCDPILQKRLITGGTRFYNGTNRRDGISRPVDMLLIDTGERKLIYLPRGNSVEIRQCLMECSEDYFDFLVFSNGTRNVDQIKNEVFRRIPAVEDEEIRARTILRFDEILNSLRTTDLITTN